jgi:NaMN:DMB phosphoribosyltransferase
VALGAVRTALGSTTRADQIVSKSSWEFHIFLTTDPASCGADRGAEALPEQPFLGLGNRKPRGSLRCTDAHFLRAALTGRE